MSVASYVYPRITQITFTALWFFAKALYTINKGNKLHYHKTLCLLKNCSIKDYTKCINIRKKVLIVTWIHKSEYKYFRIVPDCNVMTKDQLSC